MSDWKNRATPVESASSNNWKSRATSIDAPAVPEQTGLEYPMGRSASLVIPKNIEPDRAEAFKQGISSGGTFNYIAPDKELAKKYPGPLNTGKAIGNLIPAIGLGGLLSVVGKAIPGVTAASEYVANAPGAGGALARIGTTALQSGTQGAIAGGITNPDEGQTRLQNASEQGLAALVSGGILQAVAETPGLIKGAAKSFADREAFKALNPTKSRQVQNIVEAKKAPEIGATLRETGVIGGIPSTRNGIAQKANEAVEQVGEKLGSKIDEIASFADGLGSSKTGKEVVNPLVSQPKVGIDRQAIADHLEKELLQDHAGIPTLEDKYSKVQKLIDRFRSGGKGFLSIKEAQKLKTALGKSINWNRPFGTDMPESEVFDRAIYHTLSGGIEDAADVASQQMGTGVANEYRLLKKQYGNLKSAAAIANKAAVGEYTNRFISPSDYGVGMFSSLLGASPTAAVTNMAIGAMANKGVRTFGNQVFSGAGQGIANTMENLAPLAEGISTYAPQIANTIAPNYSTEIRPSSDFKLHK